MPNGQTQKQEQDIDMGLVMYFLSGMGRSLSDPGSTADVIGGMTQQQIRARSQMNLIRELLKGGGKFNMDRENISIKAPVSAFGGYGLGSEDPQITGAEGMTMAPTPVPAPQPVGRAYDPLNPLQTLPGIGDVSLAGLTPEDISQAFQLKLGVEEIRRKKLSDLMTYAGVAAKDTRTTLQKNYEFAQSQGFEGTIVDFQNTSETAHKKDYDEAVTGGYTGKFHDWMFEMAQAGAINLGELREREVLKKEVASEEYFTSPKFSKDIDKWIGENEQRRQYEAEADKEGTKARMTKAKIEGDIVASGGYIVKVDRDGRTMVWTVRFKSGITKEVRYAF